MMQRVNLSVPVAGVVSQRSLLIPQVAVAQPVINDSVAVMWAGNWAAAVVVAAKQPAKGTEQQAAATGGS